MLEARTEEDRGGADSILYLCHCFTVGLFVVAVVIVLLKTAVKNEAVNW